jgi:hypothetical protein
MSKRHVRPFHQLNFAAKVTKARPVARAILLRAIDGPDDTPLVEDLAALTDDQALAHGDPEISAAEYTRLRERVLGAIALGVAIGLSLNSETFGGAR